MNTKISAPVLIAILLIAVVVGGEAIVVFSSHNDYSSDISVNGEVIDVSAHTNGSHVLNVLSLSDSYDTPDSVYVYYDKSYGSKYNNVKVAVGARALDQENYVKQMVETLKVRDIPDAKIIDATELATIASSNGKGIALVCVSGALPDTVYNGTEDSPILDWIKSGGRLYWAGNIVGQYIAHVSDVETVTGGTALFMGSDCIDDEITNSYDKWLGNGLTESLAIINNNVRYSPVVSELPADSKYVAFGYTDGSRFSSIVVGLGEGSVCIVGGDYSDYQRIDMAQILASGISPSTVLTDSFEGSIHGSKTVQVQKADHVYVCMGGDLLVYGKLHEVE